MAEQIILLVSLNLRTYFDQVYRRLLTQLNSMAKIQRATNANAAIRGLSEHIPPLAVLITDEALTREENSGVWAAVLQYVRQGGTCIVMGHFPSFVNPSSIKPFFSRAGLQWENASYKRATVVLNQEAVGEGLALRLSPRYSLKAVFLVGVSSADAWYITNKDSVIGSHFLSPASAHVEEECPVVFAGVGNGKLGYIGDGAKKDVQALLAIHSEAQLQTVLLPLAVQVFGRYLVKGLRLPEPLEAMRSLSVELSTLETNSGIGRPRCGGGIFRHDISVYQLRVRGAASQGRGRRKHNRRGDET
ncbi:hypothetical protein F4818DRAFT_441505 [Hypoxylon cercidicola]|nr:hypothetical protein F4818DRAFT_441505 [Hypoxylon cercidicola]